MTESQDPWPTGGDPNLGYKRLIGGGGFASVHELFEKDSNRVFARKVLHLDFHSAAVKNELRAIDKLCNGGHKNVIKVIGHGKISHSTYNYIDMELCDMDLNEYIQSARTFSCVHEFNDEYMDLVFWDIMKQISSGLAFIHGNDEIHRDVKPKNVLYSSKSKCWKLTDFGIMSEGTSEVAIPTVSARGTAGYRAPELIVYDNPVYTKKVDIWALGCLLYELATGEKLFHTDTAVLDHYRSEQSLDVKINRAFGERHESRICESIDVMVCNDPKSRPSASDLVKTFSEHHASLERVHSRLNILHVSSSTDVPIDEKFVSYRLIESTSATKNREPEVSEWTCYDTIVNSPNTRVVTVSYDDDRTQFRVRLWDASGEIVRELQEPWNGQCHVSPTFSENGRFLGIYSNYCIKILDTQFGDLVNQCMVPEERKVTAISIAGNGKRIAFARDLDEKKPEEVDAFTADMTTERFPDLNQTNAERRIDVITTNRIKDAALTYLAGGSRLLHYGKWKRGAVMDVWDARTLVHISSFYLGGDDPYHRIGLPQPIQVEHEPYIAMTGLYTVSSPLHYAISTADSNGRVGQNYYGTHMVHGCNLSGSSMILENCGDIFRVQNRSIVSLRGTRLEDWKKPAVFGAFLWRADSETGKLKLAGQLRGDNIPSLKIVKAFIETNTGLVLILEDEKFMFLKKE